MSGLDIDALFNDLVDNEPDLPLPAPTAHIVSLFGVTVDFRNPRPFTPEERVLLAEYIPETKDIAKAWLAFLMGPCKTTWDAWDKSLKDHWIVEAADRVTQDKVSARQEAAIEAEAKKRIIIPDEAVNAELIKKRLECIEAVKVPGSSILRAIRGETDV